MVGDRRTPSALSTGFFQDVRVCEARRRRVSFNSSRKSKPRQAGTESSKIRPNLSQENPWISFAGSNLFKGLRRPPGPKNPPSPLFPDKFVFNMRYRGAPAGFRLGGVMGGVGVRCSPPIVCLPSHYLRFGVLRLLGASEELAPLASRTVERPRVRLGDRAALGDESRRPASTGAVSPVEQGKRQGNSIRCPARMRPLEKSPIRLEPWLADGRQPFMP
jgi:hypothetical protein